MCSKEEEALTPRVLYGKQAGDNTEKTVSAEIN